MNVQRLRDELAEVERCFAARVLRYPGVGWHAWGVGFVHGRFSVIVRYAPSHPYEPHRIYFTPAPANRHYYVHGNEDMPRLCSMMSHEWRPDYRLIVSVGIAVRFLNEYAGGVAV